LHITPAGNKLPRFDGCGILCHGQQGTALRIEVPVDKLIFGMYVAELDRPWTDTPFMYQGFEINSEKQLEALKKHCKKVYIDTEKGVDLPPQGATGSGSRGVLASIKTKVKYEEKAGVETELPQARQALVKTAVVFKEVFDGLQAGKALDAPRARDAVSSMTDSVVRNPDAMLLLAKMKEKGAHALDRAVGVSVYMITFGRFLQLPRDQLELLGMLGLLQDVGMVRVPAGLLEKSEALSDAEFEVYKTHVQHSVSLLRESSGLPAELAELAALHHERFDGSGYPKGLKGKHLGLFGSIAGLVDCFDGLTQPRPYGEAMPPSNALSQLYKWRGTLFDGPLVEQFIQCIGIFPVGAIVELNSGAIGIVIAQNLVRRLLPRVMVVLDANGNRLNPQIILDLVKEPKMDPETPYRIRRTLEKGSVAIDPSEFFL
jgi:HD-GYP domain-containing protein (c-di-GMP phosphodiesterase class II)